MIRPHREGGAAGRGGAICFLFVCLKRCNEHNHVLGALDALAIKAGLFLGSRSRLELASRHSGGVGNVLAFLPVLRDICALSPEQWAVWGPPPAPGLPGCVRRLSSPTRWGLRLPNACSLFGDVLTPFPGRRNQMPPPWYGSHVEGLVLSTYQRWMQDALLLDRKEKIKFKAKCCMSPEI